MALTQATRVMGRLRELRAAFGADQRAAVIEELFGFLGEVLPLMEEIDGSLRDSTGCMPHATRQLQNVTEATEVATIEILDLVEGALQRLDQLSGRPAIQNTPAVEAAEALRALLRTHVADAAARAEAERLLDAAQQAAFQAFNPADRPALDEARDHLNRILIALQVQDITAQQIAAVTHLIGSIQSRLKTLLHKLAADGPEPDADTTPAIDAGTLTFNAAARYDRSGSPQALVDEFMAGGTPQPFAEERDAAKAHFDIDALFRAPMTALASLRPAGRETASQSDIDALFGGA